MLTKKAKKRILFLTLIVGLSLTAIFFIFKALNNNLLYFKSPSDILNISESNMEKSIRLGGIVKAGSLKISRKEIKFIITDLKNEIVVSYQGTVPNLFLEDKGVIAIGKLKDKKYFIASKILAKHDENYMPPEIKKND